MFFEPPRRPKRRPVLLAAAAATFAAALAIAACTSEAPAPATTTAPPLTIRGTLQVDSVGPAWKLGAFCFGDAGHEDIAEGAQVTVTDPAGKVIALGKLGPGVVAVHPTLGDPGKTCMFPVTVAGVPGGLGIYGIEVAHRGKVQYPEATLASPIELTLK